eukprot:269122_1
MNGIYFNPNSFKHSYAKKFNFIQALSVDFIGNSRGHKEIQLLAPKSVYYYVSDEEIKGSSSAIVFVDMHIGLKKKQYHEQYRGELKAAETESLTSNETTYLDRVLVSFTTSLECQDQWSRFVLCWIESR